MLRKEIKEKKKKKDGGQEKERDTNQLSSLLALGPWLHLAVTAFLRGHAKAPGQFGWSSLPGSGHSLPSPVGPVVLCWEKSAVGTRNHGTKHIRLGGLAESQSTVAREC